MKYEVLDQGSLEKICQFASQSDLKTRKLHKNSQENSLGSLNSLLGILDSSVNPQMDFVDKLNCFLKTNGFVSKPS